MAQETKPKEISELEERIARLEKEKELLQKEKDVLDAARALDDAKTGPSAAARETQRLAERLALLTEQKNVVSALTPELPQGLAGSISIDENQSIEAQIAAYNTLALVAKDIAERIRTAKAAAEQETEEEQPEEGEEEEGEETDDATPSGVVILATPEDLSALAALQLFEDEARELQLALERHAAQTEAISSLLAIGPLIKTAADVAALFRTDTEFKARVITISDETLVAAVGGQLDGVRYYPRAFPTTKWNVGVIDDLDGAFLAAEQRHRDTVALEPTGETAKTERERLISAWEALEPKYRTFRDALRTRDAGTGMTPLTVIARGSWLREELARKPRVVLLKVLHAGGTYVLKKRFWRGATLAQSGGLVAQYMIFDGDGRLLDGGTVQQIRNFNDLDVVAAAEGARRDIP